MVYLYSLPAACLLGFGFALQQHAAEREPLHAEEEFQAPPGAFGKVIDGWPTHRPAHHGDSRCGGPGSVDESA
ncbi:hypothetical protein ABZ137_02625 [Streptomyces bobili]|uniref:hypothetical protein n=1 Tax=Streptomyces bobili TaxID=67280 RepID=UPI0033BC6450